MASQEPWDIGAALPVSCTASEAAERDLFTDRECNHTHTLTDNGPPSLHFSPTAMSESVSQCVSVVEGFSAICINMVLCGGKPEELCL